MASRLNPYISFKDNAREAMEFYQSVFGGRLDINTFSEYGGAPDGMSADGTMHAHLETDAGFVLMASDTPPGMAEAGVGTSGSNISVSVSGDDEDELRGYWDKLCDGGEVSMPMEKQMWGDIFGMVKDRYGVTWMVDVVAADAPAGS